MNLVLRYVFLSFVGMILSCPSAFADDASTSTTPTLSLSDCDQVSGLKSVAEAQAPGGPVAVDCKNQIKKSLDSCVQGSIYLYENDMVGTDAMKADGTVDGSSKLMQIDQDREQKEDAQSDLCRQAYDNLNKICKSDLSNWKNKIDQEQNSESSAKRDAAQMQVGPFMQVNRNWEMAAKALKNAYSCHVSQSQIYQKDAMLRSQYINKAGVVGFGQSEDADTVVNTATSAGSNGTEASVQNLYDSAKETSVKVGLQQTASIAESTEGSSVTSGALNGVTNVAKSTATSLESVRPTGFAALYASGGDGLSVISSGAEAILPEAVGDVVSGPLSVGAMVLQSDPAGGHCDTIYTEPVQAARDGCSVATPSGAQVNEMAISTLEQK